MPEPRSQRSLCTPMALWLLLSGSVAAAGSIDVRVVGPNGQPVPEVAVFVLQEGASESPRSAPGTAVMDQRAKRFDPHLLVVRKGTAVAFPNSDVIAHHVYSFSKPNDFVLPLYKGEEHEPVVFEHDGVVTIGCNIHDNMLGYIVVVDTDAYAVTDNGGRATLPISDTATSYEVNVWSPRIRDRQETLVQRVIVADTQGLEITFALQKRLRPPHDEQADSVQWSEY